MMSENRNTRGRCHRLRTGQHPGAGGAIAAGAATIYRNYFVPVGDRVGQTADRQVDTLAALGAAVSEFDRPFDRQALVDAERLRTRHR